MSSISSPKNLPTNAELLELIKKQDDVIEELSIQLEAATLAQKNESESDENEISEALSVNQKLLIEMKNKLKESVEIMEQLQEKNTSLSMEIKQLRETQLGFSPASESLFEMHNLLENEREEMKRIQDELFGVKRSEQKKDGMIKDLESELERTRRITEKMSDEMKKKIEDLLKEVGDKSTERNAALMDKKEAEERLEALEENCRLKTNLLEEHCKKLQSEIGILTKKKIFLNERIRNLSEEMAILRQKLIDSDFDYFGDDEVKALIKEQKAIIESTRAENAALKDEIRKFKSVKNYQQKHSKERRRAVDELIDKYLLKL